MIVIDKGSYALVDTGTEKYSIVKGAVIVTQIEDSVLLRLRGTRKVLVNIPYKEYEGATSSSDLADKLVKVLY